MAKQPHRTDPQLDALDRQIGKRLRTFRLERQMTRASLARKLNVPLRTLASYESGELACPASLLFEAAKVLGVGMLSFFEAEPSK